MNGTTTTVNNFALNSAHPNPPPPSTDHGVMPSYTYPRNVSGPLAVQSAVMGHNENTAPTCNCNNSHGTQLSAKTKQHIDKITTENERLRRELRAEKLAREEEAKRVSAARSRAEDSQKDYQNLQLLADTNARAVERKDRKIEELKASLEAEVKRRKASEQRAEEALKMLGDTRSETQRQLATAYEQKHLAETNADAAKDGFKRITDSYDKKLKNIREELHDLRKQRIEDADKIKRQAIISDQLHHEMSRTWRTEDRMVDMMGAYKKEHRKEMDALVQEAKMLRMTLPEKEKEATELVESMRETRDKMKWVMAQNQRQTGT